MGGRKRKSAALAVEMASGVLASNVSTNSANKHIPLYCTVCPETPRFSDVSHLLTHIASKGHLHHETQMKLKAHQDMSAAMALRSYEQWYRDNGIETLLVERMKAKQIKEAARGRRARSIASAPMAKGRRKPKRSMNEIDNFDIKLRHDGLAPDFPLFPGILHSDEEIEIPDDYLIGKDALSLKGQIWPGMGKMDLANDEMRRTRNQRKPKSVIDNMRRISEGIEPTQVVMTPDLEVETVKGVYDSSPIPGQEEATPPRKSTRAKRKKQDALQDLPPNVPRQNASRVNGTIKRRSAKFGYDREGSSGIPSSAIGSFRHHSDVFRDDDRSSSTASPFEMGRGFAALSSSLFDNRPLSTSAQQDHKFDLRERLTLPSSNPILHPQVISPITNTRNMPSRLFPGRDASYDRVQAHSFLGSFRSMETSQTLQDGPMFGSSSGSSFTAGSHFNDVHDVFRLSPSTSLQSNQDDFPHPSGIDSINSPATGQFMDSSAANPLYSRDRLLLSTYSQPMSYPSIPPLSFTPINRFKEEEQTNAYTPNHTSFRSAKVKAEQRMDASVDNHEMGDEHQPNFDPNSPWDPQATNADIDLHGELGSDSLQV